jgi:hypothetical protein
VENELEVLKRSSAARIDALEGQLRAAATAAAAADLAAVTAAAAATTAAVTAAAAADSAAATAAHKIELLEHKLFAAVTATATVAAAADSAAATAAAAVDFAAATAAAAAANAAVTAAHEIELLENKLSTQATIFELKLTAAKDSSTKSIRIARLEERISVASLRAELSARKNPAIPGQGRNFSS